MDPNDPLHLARREFIQRANEARAWEDAYLAASKQYSPWSNHGEHRNEKEMQEAKRKAAEKREAKKCHRITE